MRAQGYGLHPFENTEPIFFAQIETLDDRRGPQVELLLHQRTQLELVDLRRPERLERLKIALT